MADVIKNKAPMYGQNKYNEAAAEAAFDRKQVYRFGTPPLILDYEHATVQLTDGTAGDRTIHCVSSQQYCRVLPRNLVAKIGLSYKLIRGGRHLWNVF